MFFYDVLIKVFQKSNIHLFISQLIILLGRTRSNAKVLNKIFSIESQQIEKKSQKCDTNPHPPRRMQRLRPCLVAYRTENIGQNMWESDQFSHNIHLLLLALLYRNINRQFNL